jgi:hypothetical protein
MKPNLIKLPFAAKPPKPPAALGKPGRKLWQSIQSEYGIHDAGGLAHLHSACRCEDDLDRIRSRIAEDGDLIPDPKRGKQPHPLLRFVAQLEATRRQGIAALNLHVEPLRPGPGRPGGK